MIVVPPLKLAFPLVDGIASALKSGMSALVEK